MQTFVPYSDFMGSVGCLDSKRLGKQRVEAFQIINALNGKSKGWVSHPATVMWTGCVPALTQYMRCCIIEWINRGFKNTMQIPEENWDFQNPWWIGDMRVHLSHRSNLLRKEPDHYTPFGWKVPNDMPYFWPGEKFRVI